MTRNDGKMGSLLAMAVALGASGESAWPTPAGRPGGTEGIGRGTPSPFLKCERPNRYDAPHQSRGEQERRRRQRERLSRRRGAPPGGTAAAEG